jgi:hypothetical protein
MKRICCFLFVLILFLSGCNLQKETAAPCEGEDIPAPPFLDSYWPKNGSNILFSEYEESRQKGDVFSPIGVRYYNHYVDTCPILNTDLSIGGRTQLFIDGEVTPYEIAIDELMMFYGEDNNGIYCEMADGPTVISWAPELPIGPHHLELKIVSNTGKEYEFAWCFTIVENEKN